MVRMIPPKPRNGANKSEKKIFTALEGMTGHDDWIVLHSVRVARHESAFMGEADFLVLAPGRGIAVIEAKSPSSARYEGGDWHLENTPTPSKDPLEQLDGVRGSLRKYLRELGMLRGDEPIARLLWFTSLGRHDFENGGDIQLFEWELGWRDDLSRPAWLLEHLFDEHDAWYSEVDGVEHDPAGFTTEHVEEIHHALLGNFHVSESVADRMRERSNAEAALLAEQSLILEITARNTHLFLEGPAGTGKSHILTLQARRHHKAGLRTLVTCWNRMMAQELGQHLGWASNVDVYDMNALMLQLAGLEENPSGSPSTWYTEDLPKLALEGLKKNPRAGGYEALLIDEYQDIGGYPLLQEVLDAICAGGSASQTPVLLAADGRQQIMRALSDRTAPFSAAKKWLPGLMHVRVSRNCRNTQEIIVGAESMMPKGLKLGFTGHRLPQGIPGGLSVRDASSNESAALSTALRELMQEYAPEQIVVLSPFAETRSLAGRLLAGQDRSRGERWLRSQLESAEGTGKVRWRSIFKFKGLDADAVILTDIGETAKQFVAENELSFADLLYVGLTRAKYRCIVLSGD